MTDKACIHGYTHCDKCHELADASGYARQPIMRPLSPEAEAFFLELPLHIEVRWMTADPPAPSYTFMITGIRDPEHPSPPKGPDRC